jgi:hypothetical protein
MSVRRLASPRGVCVRLDASGVPAELQGQAVESVLEEWVVEDRWWTGRPVRRHYFELVLAGGRNAVVFKELGERRGFFEQRG